MEVLVSGAGFVTDEVRCGVSVSVASTLAGRDFTLLEAVLEALDWD